MKKIITCIFLLFITTGCWNYKELNDYAIITGISIDKSEEGYEVSTLISNSPKSSSDSSSNESQIVVYSGKGSSIVESLKNVGIISPKELYLGSFSILVISEDIAKDGINDVLDFFLRYSDSRKNFNIIITKDCKAKDTLKIMTPITSFPSQNITDNINSTSELQGIIAKTDFNKLLSILLTDGIEASINSISIEGDVDIGSKKENLESSEPYSTIKLGTLGIFKDDKLIKWSNEDESLGINIINNQIDEIYFKIDYEDGYIIIDTTDSKSNVEVSLINDSPYVTVNVSGEAKIIESNGNIDLKNIETVEKLKKKANEKIEYYINQAMNLAIENKTDIFGFGLNFYKNYPSYYEKNKETWNDNLKIITLKVNSNLSIKNKVSAKNSLKEVIDEG